jgi:hypothetical protein
MVARFFEGSLNASLEVTRQREVATEHTFLIGVTGAGGAERLGQGQQSDYSREIRVTTAGGVKRLQQGECIDYCRGSKATTAGGAKPLQQGEQSLFTFCKHKQLFVYILNCRFAKLFIHPNC